MNNDLISREYVKLFVCEYEKFNGKETEIVKAVPIIAIDNAPTVEERPQGETNSEIFKQTFGIYATELWSMKEADFLKWLNTEVEE